MTDDEKATQLEKLAAAVREGRARVEMKREVDSDIVTDPVSWNDPSTRSTTPPCYCDRPDLDRTFHGTPDRARPHPRWPRAGRARWTLSGIT